MTSTARPRGDGAPSRQRRHRLIGWVAAIVVGLSAFVYGSIDEGEPLTNADRVHRLSQNYACPQCNGQSVAESDVPVARAIRAQIREFVDAGSGEDEITAALVATYGEDIDYTPSASGITSLVWVLPVLFAVGAAAGLGFAFWRWRQLDARTASDADRQLVERHRAEP